MTRLITAAEALRLPSATLSEDEQKLVEELLAKIDAGIRQKMQRHGFEFRTDRTNPAVIFEVTQVLQDAGYIVQVQPLMEPPRVHGAQAKHVGYALSCAPGREAVEAAKRVIQ